MRREPTKKVRIGAIAAAIAALAAWLRFHSLGRTFPLGDEYLQFYLALHPRSLPEFLFGIRSIPAHLLLDPLTTYFVGLWRDSPGWLRFPSAVWGVVAVEVLRRLAQSGGRSTRGLVAAFLLAISLIHIEWSRRADLYSLMALTSLLQGLAFLELGEDPDRWRHYGLCAVMSLYAHPYASIVGILHFACAALTPSVKGKQDRLKALLRAWALAGACFWPWFLFSARQLMQGISFDAPGIVSLWTLKEFALRMPLLLCQATEVAGSSWNWGALNAGLAATAYMLLYTVSLARVLRGEADDVARLAHVMVLGGILCVIGLDLAYHFYFAPRQLLWILPFYLFSVADGWIACLERIGALRVVSAWAMAGAAAFLCFAVAFPAYQEAVSEEIRLTRGQEAIIAALDRHWQQGQILAFRNEQLARHFLYGFDREAFRDSLGRRWAQEDEKAGKPAKRFKILVASDDPAWQALRADLSRRLRTWFFDGRIGDLRVEPPFRT